LFLCRSSAWRAGYFFSLVPLQRRGPCSLQVIGLEDTAAAAAFAFETIAARDIAHVLRAEALMLDAGQLSERLPADLTAPAFAADVIGVLVQRLWEVAVAVADLWDEVAAGVGADVMCGNYHCC
jgi:hypothetical protein